MNAEELWAKVGLKTQYLLKCFDESSVKSSATLDGRAKEVASHHHRPMPRPPIGSRYYQHYNLKTKSQSVISGQAVRKSIEFSMLVASNNDYLLAYHNITSQAMFTYLVDHGIRMTDKSYTALKQGKYWNVNLIIISAMALFWGEPLDRFLTQDYAHLKLKPIKPEPPKNLKPRGSINANHLRSIYNLSGNPCY